MFNVLSDLMCVRRVNVGTCLYMKIVKFKCCLFGEFTALTKNGHDLVANLL